jgi:hypothetical protein
MPLCETRSRHDRQGHFAEGFQQAFSRGLGRPPFGIASEKTSQFLVLFRELLVHHPFQQGENAASARVSKRTNPTRWSSRCTYNGANDNGRPLRRAKFRSTKYSSR